MGSASWDPRFELDSDDPERAASLRSLVRRLGPFRNLATGPEPVFYADIERGVRVALTVERPVPGVSEHSLLIARRDRGWDVFGDHGLLAGLPEDRVQITVQG